MRFPAKKNAGCPKAPRDFLPRWVVLGLPSPFSRVCTEARMLTSQPKFLASIGYQICLAMVLRWSATRAGFANRSHYQMGNNILYV